jgi:hypothetical protein
VRGRIVYVERVDPDGDGDLHVVVADGSITAPGLTSIDVRPGLRPERDPRVGTWPPPRAPCSADRSASRRSTRSSSASHAHPEGCY